jgi:MFS family permease
VSTELSVPDTRRAADTAARGVGFGPRFAIPVLIGPALNPVNTTMISVALVPIAAAVHVSAATSIWLVAVLYLVSAVSQPTMGKLADHFGPRVIYLVGLVLVAAAGVVPLLFPTFAGALVARILIGVGTSSAYPSAMTLISDQSARLGAKPPQLLLSGLSMSSLVTAAAGPVLGGVLIVAFGWQSIFLVNTPLAAAAFVMAFLWLPRDSTRVKQRAGGSAMRAIDPVGILLFAVAIASALVFLLDLGSRLFWLVPIAVVGLAVLIWWERRSARPFIDVRMLAANGPLTRTYLRLFLVYTSAYLVVYALSQWIQSSAGFTSDVAGLIQIPSAVLAATGSILIARTTKIRLPLIITAVAPLVGGLLIVTLHSASPLWFIAGVAAMFGIPQGLGSISNQVALYRQAPAEQIGVAAGLSRTSIQLGAILASSVIGLVFGQAATDGGIHTIGWIVAGFAAAATVLTVADRGLSSTAAPRPSGASRNEPDTSVR